MPIYGQAESLNLAAAAAVAASYAITPGSCAAESPRAGG